MTPKEFIEVVFLHDLANMIESRPYISFSTMATGIEFLGKCMDDNATHWNVSGRSKINFEAAINQLTSFEPYRKFLDSHRLWDSLRNGFSHSFVPKYPITLSSRNEMAHLIVHSNNLRLNLKCEDLFTDFKNACLEIINKDFPDSNNKMNKQLLSVPELED
ncbi:MAG TPA: hypothetical protein VK666_11965 [Chryseolinea sp.]|nr:hypothetical protein [Chryseolinea sp.]